MTTQTLSPAAESLLGRLRGSTRQFWLTPAETVADSWVLVAPVRLVRRVACVKIKESVICELVRAGQASWTASDEKIPEYLAGALTREAWFPGRCGRRISAVGGESR